MPDAEAEPEQTVIYSLQQRFSTWMGQPKKPQIRTLPTLRKRCKRPPGVPRRLRYHEPLARIFSPGRQPAFMCVGEAEDSNHADDVLRWHTVPGPLPVAALAGRCTPGLALHSSHSYGYDFRSRAAVRRTCPASETQILVQYPG